MRVSLRARILLFVMALAIIPAVVISVWLQRSALRSGEDLLRSRMSDRLEETATALARRWSEHRSLLLNVVERTEDLNGMASRLDSTLTHSTLSQEVDRVELRDANNRVHWSYSPARTQLNSDAGIPVLLPIRAATDQRTIATLEIWWQLQPLIAVSGLGTTRPEGVLSVIEPRSHTALLALPFDVETLRQDKFSWAGDDWIVQRRPMDDPRIDLIAAAPLAPLTQPLRAAAQRGVVVLLSIAASAALLAYLLSRRLILALGQLDAAASAVAAGDLGHRVNLQRSDELGALATSFNRMTANLQDSLQQLSQKESLAAVGEFAAELAHEVRNPLSSVRLDLQYVQERLPADSPLRDVQTAALETTTRLGLTVSTALTAARSDKLSIAPLELRQPLLAAARSAEPFFDTRSARLHISIGDEPLTVAGDGAALEQVVLNLLVNASEAISAGGNAVLSTQRHGDRIEVSVSDDGVGMSLDVQSTAFDPLFTTKRSGTGLGLAISRRIARAHGGELEVVSRIGAGSTFTLRLPVCIDPMQPASKSYDSNPAGSPA